MESQEIPEDWRMANICALFKKGSKKLPNNYRPVSLTSQVVKIFERAILEQLLQFSRDYNIFTCHQHGFQAGCSCLTNLLECLNDWTQDFGHPQTGIDIIYTDFKKAFDSVPHQRLVHKLSKYGIQGKLNGWLHAFLANRSQRVILNGSPSKWTQVISVVPQGTILGPILFLFYVNDLPDHVTSTAKLFADDCKAYRAVRTRLD